MVTINMTVWPRHRCSADLMPAALVRKDSRRKLAGWARVTSRDRQVLRRGDTSAALQICTRRRSGIQKGGPGRAQTRLTGPEPRSGEGR